MAQPVGPRGARWTPGEGSHTVVVGLGSNLGERLGHLIFGLRRMEEIGIVVDLVSSVVETPPVGYASQPDFLNMAALASTDLPPRRVLSIFQEVEEAAGRARGFRNGPRTLDLDLLFYDEMILREEGMQVPHPRWKGRSFVVLPLLEICPGLRDPETGFQVKDVAGAWPLEPEGIRTFLPAESFQRAFKEWKR